MARSISVANGNGALIHRLWLNRRHQRLWITISGTNNNFRNTFLSHVYACVPVSFFVSARACSERLGHQPANVNSVLVAYSGRASQNVLYGHRIKEQGLLPAIGASDQMGMSDPVGSSYALRMKSRERALKFKKNVQQYIQAYVGAQDPAALNITSALLDVYSSSHYTSICSNNGVSALVIPHTQVYILVASTRPSRILFCFSGTDHGSEWATADKYRAARLSKSERHTGRMLIIFFFGLSNKSKLNLKAILGLRLWAEHISEMTAVLALLMVRLALPIPNAAYC